MRMSLLTTILSAQAWKPTDLGAALYDYWDAEAPGTIDQSAGAVSAWRGAKAGTSAEQATAANQPIYSPTSFGGRPGVTFDGTNDNLTALVLPSVPVVGECEFWGLVDQTVVAATTGNRWVIALGGGTNNMRGLLRASSGSQNQVAAYVSDGATSATSAYAADFSGKHIGRAAIGTATVVYLDGAGPSIPAALTPNLITSRIRLGAIASTTASGFFGGVMNFAAITAPLSVDQAAQMTRFLKARAGLA